MSAALLSARVTHRRQIPAANAFTYGVDYMMLPADAKFWPKTRLMSRDRFNLVSWRAKDHGVGPKRGSADWADALLDARGVPPGQTWVICQPRYWSVTFNPISIWARVGPDGALLGFVAEVNNTFGDRVAYVMTHPDGGPIGPNDWLRSDKAMHVSPFFEVKGAYRFRLSIRPDRFDLWIVYHDDAGGGLFTAMHGPMRPITDRVLGGVLLRRPLGAMKTVALIYWQALKLRFKGLAYHRRPPPPSQDVLG